MMSNLKISKLLILFFPPKKDKSISISKAEGIKLKGGVMLATKYDFAKISDDDICYALVC